MIIYKKLKDSGDEDKYKKLKNNKAFIYFTCDVTAELKLDSSY